MPVIPEKLSDLFNRPIVVALATLMPDGAPQVTPVWFDYDGEHIRVNSARGRQKDRNMTLGAKVTVLIIDPQNPYHWAEARGEIAHITEEGAVEHINHLSQIYFGRPFKLNSPDEVRVMYKIAIEKINGS